MLWDFANAQPGGGGGAPGDGGCGRAPGGGGGGAPGGGGGGGAPGGRGGGRVVIVPRRGGDRRGRRHVILPRRGGGGILSSFTRHLSSRRKHALKHKRENLCVLAYQYCTEICRYEVGEPESPSPRECCREAKGDTSLQDNLLLATLC
ncbi:unnamed protein product [Arabidopsis halleri]